jgi:hypothetical protein
MTEERNYEEEARSQGWRPKEDFDGPEEKWTDEKTFVEKGDKIAGILKSRLDKQDATIRELQSANKEFGEYQKKLRETEKKKSEQLLHELEALRAKAVTDGDGQEFTRIDKEITRTRESLSEKEPPKKQELDPAAQQWVSENSWYGSNQKLSTYADGVADRVSSEGYMGPAYYAEITRRVKEAFPDDFKNPKRNGANSVEQGSEIDTPSSKSAKTYENLPKEAKDACNRYVKNGLITKEDYVKNYEW